MGAPNRKGVKLASTAGVLELSKYKISQIGARRVLRTCVQTSAQRMSAVADATIDAKTASFMAKSCPAAITKACSRAHAMHAAWAGRRE